MLPEVKQELMDPEEESPLLGGEVDDDTVVSLLQSMVKEEGNQNVASLDVPIPSEWISVGTN